MAAIQSARILKTGAGRINAPNSNLAYPEGRLQFRMEKNKKQVQHGSSLPFFAGKNLNA
jgi:hypothetical protein